MNEPEKWDRVTSEIVGDHRVFKVRKDLCRNSNTGADASFFVIECPDWVNVIPVTEQGEVVLIEQFRQGIEEITLEIPGGMVDTKESPIDTAKRELTEETAYCSDEFVEIGKARPNPAIQNNWIHYFLATNCELKGETRFDEHESIVTKLVPIEDIPELIESGKIFHSLVIAAFHFLMLKNRNGELV